MPTHQRGWDHTLHRCLIDLAVPSLAGAAELPISAVAHREAPGGVPAVALLPWDDCQGELLWRRENR